MKDQVEARRVDLGGGVSMFMLAAPAGVRAGTKRPRAASNGKAKAKHKLNGANGKAPHGFELKDR